MTARAKPERQRKFISAQDKCRAVLAVWVEQRTASEVCRQMGIRSALFTQWQAAAMEGMLSALEPTRRKEEAGRAWSPRLQKLLEKKSAERALSCVVRRAKEEGRRPRPTQRLACLRADTHRQANAGPPTGAESPAQI